MDAPIPFNFRSPGRAHLVGAGGSGMTALAGVLADLGWQVSGCDARTFDETSACCLARRYVGHDAAHVDSSVDLVVHSAAISPSHVELVRAAALAIPTLSYAAALGALTADKKLAVVAGTHGKSTVTAMVGQILAANRSDATVVYGAEPIETAVRSRAGGGDWAIVEACEYRSHFLQLAPRAVALLAVEPDHFDCFATDSEMIEAYRRLIAKIPRDGLLVVRDDSPRALQIAQSAPCRVETFGVSAGADWRAENPRADGGRYRFAITRYGRDRFDVSLLAAGHYNVANATAAAALATRIGASAESIAEGLGRFAGLRRRLERIGDRQGVTWYDDYAHHPTEVEATLRAVREMHPGRRIWCVLQPHQASRTERLLHDFAQSLQLADRVAVAEIFRARESEAIRGEISAADLARATRQLGRPTASVYDLKEIERELIDELVPGDVLVALGAGDIGKWQHEFFDRFGELRSIVAAAGSAYVV